MTTPYTGDCLLCRTAGRWCSDEEVVRGMLVFTPDGGGVVISLHPKCEEALLRWARPRLSATPAEWCVADGAGPRCAVEGCDARGAPAVRRVTLRGVKPERYLCAKHNRAELTQLLGGGVP